MTQTTAATPATKLRRWPGFSYRQRLTLGVTLLHAALMSVLVFDSLHRQHGFLHRQGRDHTASLASTLAVSSRSWVMANDVVGLQEVTASVAGQRGIRYVMILGPDMRVLSHSDPERIGLFVTDEQSLSLMDIEPDIVDVMRSHSLEDVAAPIRAGNRLLGWARVGMGQEHIRQNVRSGMLHGIFYIALGSLAAYLFGRLLAGRLTAGLQRLMRGFDRVGAGERGLRLDSGRADELGQLEQNFNRMVKELEANEQRLQEMATTDFLTGLYNRRSFMQRIQSELARMQRGTPRPVAVLMLDLDHFKVVNDTYGHVAGDAVLRHVAELIRNSLREVDFAGRFGGEEFVLLLTDADLEGAGHLAERLRVCIEQKPTSWNNGTIPITVSIGLTLLRKEDALAEEAVNRADEALYRAKAQGRNQVVIQV